jgi:aspartyl-tRNA(Asn)/glutamyl-tRNA(Gln) amidotransferase subunit B
MSQAPLTPTIGLEVHLHLATRTKLFCGCEVKYDARPNSCVCPVCLGLPGVLPVMNELAVTLSIRMALALNCEIPALAKWDRKHYYYPDLPKNYQISEYDQPLGVGGYLDIETSQGPRRIGITRVHLEEDAGKLMHAENGNYSVVDLNRTGTPLLEIVSEPDMHTPEEARLYAESIRQLAVYLGVGHCNMQLGQMRCEPNVSLLIASGEGGKPRYTPISELKNLNSFRSVERAVTYEIARHREEYAADPEGYTLEKQGKSTMGWRDDEGVSFLQRSKEEAHDYRYLPEPDLVPVAPARAWVEELRKTVPELPEKRRVRFIRDFGLPEYDAGVLTADRTVADFYETVAARTQDPKAASNWMMQDVMRELNERKIAIADLPVKAEGLAELITLVKQGTINRNTAAEVFNKMLAGSKSAGQIVQEENLAQTSDTGALEAIVDQVLAANAKIAEDYRSGKKAAFGRLMGETMKVSGGKANPQVVKDLLTRKLGA